VEIETQSAAPPPVKNTEPNTGDNADVEFPPLEIEEIITTSNTAPASNTRQQQSSRTITQDCEYHLAKARVLFTPKRASLSKYPLQFLIDLPQPVLNDNKKFVALPPPLR
jgi:hypothetical protein